MDCRLPATIAVMKENSSTGCKNPSSMTTLSRVSPYRSVGFWNWTHNVKYCDSMVFVRVWRNVVYCGIGHSVQFVGAGPLQPPIIRQVLQLASQISPSFCSAVQLFACRKQTPLAEALANGTVTEITKAPIAALPLMSRRRDDRALNVVSSP